MPRYLVSTSKCATALPGPAQTTSIRAAPGAAVGGIVKSPCAVPDAPGFTAKSVAGPCAVWSLSSKRPSSPPGSSGGGGQLVAVIATAVPGGPAVGWIVIAGVGDAAGRDEAGMRGDAVVV